MYVSMCSDYYCFLFWSNFNQRYNSFIINYFCAVTNLMLKNIKISSSYGNEEVQSEPFLTQGMIRVTLLPNYGLSYSMKYQKLRLYPC
jgi:hypothetical protein